jgi:hypothetical protein
MWLNLSTDQAAELRECSLHFSAAAVVEFGTMLLQQRPELGEVVGQSAAGILQKITPEGIF